MVREVSRRSDAEMLAVQHFSSLSSFLSRITNPAYPEDFQDCEGFLYLAETNQSGVYKVSSTVRVGRRIKQQERASYGPLKLVHEVKCTQCRLLEARLHDDLRFYAVRNGLRKTDLFKLPVAEVSFIQSLITQDDYFEAEYLFLNSPIDLWEDSNEWFASQHSICFGRSKTPEEALKNLQEAVESRLETFRRIGEMMLSAWANPGEVQQF